MSANFVKTDREWLKNCKPTGTLNALEEAIVTSMFDADTDQDMKLIETQIKNEKLMRKVALIKTLTLGVEFPLLLMIMGWSAAKVRLEYSSIYFKFLIKKTSYEELKKQLNVHAKGANLAG